MKEKVLVIGGTGFIGSHILNSLSSKKYSLFSISKKTIKRSQKLKKVKYIKCDITNFTKLKKKLKLKFDHIINLSGYIDHSNHKQNYLCHFQGTKNLVDLLKYKNIKTFVQIGSSLEYGSIKSPQRETDNCKPIGSYAISKYKASKYIEKCGKKFNFPYIILRLYQIYGPLQKKNRLIPLTIDSCIKNKKFNCSEGLQKRDFLYIDDFTNLIKKILKKKIIRKKIYNIGSSMPIKIKNVINKIRSYIKLGKPQFGAIKMRKEEINKLYPSIIKIKKDFNWRPKIRFNTGIKKTIFFYVKNA